MNYAMIRGACVVSFVILGWSIFFSDLLSCCFFFFQSEDGIRDLVRSRGLGDVYKRQFFGGGIN